MAMKAGEVRKFLEHLGDDVLVWIDEGGLTLHDSEGGYVEVGGEPETTPPLTPKRVDDIWKNYLQRD